MAKPPTDSAVRSTLRILEAKGHIKHEIDGKRYVYLPAEAPEKAAQAALAELGANFFKGSLEGIVRTFLSDKETQIPAEELDRIATLIEEARRKEGR